MLFRPVLGRKRKVTRKADRIGLLWVNVSFGRLRRFLGRSVDTVFLTVRQSNQCVFVRIGSLVVPT